MYKDKPIVVRYRYVVPGTRNPIGFASPTGHTSDQTGMRVVARYYHFDRGSQITSDLPSEIRVSPARWGVIRF